MSGSPLNPHRAVPDTVKWPCTPWNEAHPWERFQAEVTHHAQWTWADPFGRSLALMRQGSATAELAQWQVDLWTEAAHHVADGGKALVVSHAVYAPAELIATAAVWLVQLAAMVLLFSKKSAPYYRHEPARQ